MEHGLYGGGGSGQNVRFGVGPIGPELGITFPDGILPLPFVSEI